MALPGFVASGGNYTALPLSEHDTGGAAGGESVVEIHGAIAELTDTALAAKFTAADDAQSGDLIYVGDSPYRMKRNATDARLAASWGEVAIAAPPVTALETAWADNSNADYATAGVASYQKLDMWVDPKIPAAPDLTPYARTADIPDVSGFLTSTDLPSLDPYALKTELPDVSGFATTGQLPSALNTAWSDSANANYRTTGLTSYQSLDAWVGPKLSGIPTSGAITDLSTRVTTLEGDSHPAPNLTLYALKTELPNVSGFLTSGDLPSLDPYALKTELPPQLDDAWTGLGHASYGVAGIVSFQQLDAWVIPKIPTVPTINTLQDSYRGSGSANYGLNGLISYQNLDEWVAPKIPAAPDLSAYATTSALTTLTNRVTTLESSGGGPKTTHTVLDRITEYDAGSVEIPMAPGEAAIVLDTGIDFSVADYFEFVLTVGVDPGPMDSALTPITGLASKTSQTSVNVYAIGSTAQINLSFSNPSQDVAAGRFSLRALGGSWNPQFRLSKINLWKFVQIEV